MQGGVLMVMTTVSVLNEAAGPLSEEQRLGVFDECLALGRVHEGRYRFELQSHMRRWSERIVRASARTVGTGAKLRGVMKSLWTKRS